MLGKEDPSIYQNKDGHLKRTLRVRDFLTLGVGTIVSTSIFTLPWHCCCRTIRDRPLRYHSYSLLLFAGLVAFTYAKWLPYTVCGFSYSWVNVLFGGFFGWVAGWALLAEYFIAVAFVASGSQLEFTRTCETNWHQLPAALSNPFWYKWRFYRYYAAIVILLTALLLSWVCQAARMENILVILKVVAIIFICNRRFNSNKC